MRLPIEVRPDTNPPVFRWEHVFDKYEREPKRILCEGLVSPNMEGALIALIEYTKKVEAERDELQRRLSALEENKRATLPQGSKGAKGNR